MQEVTGSGAWPLPERALGVMQKGAGRQSFRLSSGGLGYVPWSLALSFLPTQCVELIQ